MTAEPGWVEPVDAGEMTMEHDELEHWLRDIRTDLADSQPDWLAAETGDRDGDGDPAEPAAAQSPTAEPPTAQPVGRHRAAD